MKKGNYKIYIFLIIGLVLVFILAFSWILYNNQFYAKMVINAIEEENIVQLEKLIKSPFGNLNSKPTIWIFEVLGEESEVTPLQAACNKGNDEIVKILLDNGADPNYTHWDKSRNQKSALMYAASSLSKNRLQVIKLLIEYGADVNYENSIGEDVLSCLVYASSYHTDTIQIIEYLEKENIDIYKKYSGTENTLLHKACEKDDISLIEYLIEERNFDVNTLNADGDTSLVYFMRFASKRNEKILLYLLEKGADPGLKNKEGKLAYDYAVELHPEYVSLLN